MAQKPDKSLLMDCLPIDQPEGTIRFGKNGIYQLGMRFNEPGFVKSKAQLPFKVNGTIQTDDKTIFFTTDNTNSAIGYFNPKTDAYEVILDDRKLPFKLPFSQESYITGEYQRNNYGEVEIAFTDKKTMMYLNCDKPAVNKFEDLLFFIRATAPTIEVKVGNAGQIDSGSYRVAAKLIKPDGTQSQHMGLTSFVFASGDSSTDTANKSLEITLTNLDTSYSEVIVTILKLIKGVTTVIELDPVALGPTLNISYTGLENFTTITPEELLIPQKNYTSVGTIGQLNDELYLGNLTEEEDILYQRCASMIGVEFQSLLVDLNNPAQAARVESGELRGLAHEEVYALYIRRELTSGGWTRAFHIPGRALVTDDYQEVIAPNISGLKFQLQDTITGYDPSTAVGIPGAWENAAESYPTSTSLSEDQFNSASVGGPILSGKRVRHHKMPSMRFIKSQLTGRTDKTLIARYGKSVMDILGIRLTNVTTPAELQSKLTGKYEILYAKRTQNNVTNYGQSLVVYNTIKGNAQAAYNAAFKADAVDPLSNVRGKNLITVGGNWKARAGSFDPDPETAIVRESFRLYPFETLLNKPDFPDKSMYLSVNWKTQTNGAVTYPESLPNKGKPSPITPIAVVNLDLTETRIGASTTLTDVAFPLIGIGNLSYLSANTNLNAVNGVNNEGGEAAVLATVQRSAMTQDPLNEHINMLNLGEHSVITRVFPKETSYFVTLKALKTTVYRNFNTQVLITTGGIQQPLSTEFVYKGDCFIALHSFHTYGAFAYVNKKSTPWLGAPRDGYKVSRTVLVESIANLGARYEVTGNPYSYWFLRQGNLDFMTQFDKSVDPNKVGYDKSLNALPEVQAQIYYKEEREIRRFPYRIHRGGKMAREGVSRNWRKLLPLDYYDMPKNLGEVIHLEGMDDKLLIHMENALMVTQDKTKLQSDILSVTLGAGDIFQFTPQEAISSKLGLAGTSHDLACVRTPFGYVFPDTGMGQLYVYKDGIKQLNGGLNQFLREFMRVTQINTYLGHGITIGYDPEFNRLLITVKNTKPVSDRVVEDYQQTAEFYKRLTPGKSIVYKDGRWQKFLGINQTEFSM